jgi:hypothetical protein
LAPRRLASPLQSLPPILDNASQTPTSSCSKGARGLSVQPRVLGIFTETAISPDPSLRQRPSRCAIRAGRNFALIPCFQGRRLSLHLATVERALPLLHIAFDRSDSSLRRSSRSGSDLPAFDELRAACIRIRRRSVRSRGSFRTAADSSRSGGMTRSRMSPSRRVSHFTVLSLRSGRMLPHPKNAAIA